MADLTKLGNIATALEALAGNTPLDALRLEATEEAKLQRIRDSIAGSARVTELADLSDVDDSLSPSSGDSLVYDGDKWTSGVVAGPGTALSLDDLTDVTAPSPSTGQVLAYDGADWAPNGNYVTTTDIANMVTDGEITGFLTSTDIANVVTNGDSVTALSDVTISSPTTGQVLAYNATNSDWRNVAAGGGGGGGSFALVWEGVTGISVYSGTGLVGNAITVPANTVQDGDHIHFEAGGRGGSGGTNGQNLSLALPGEDTAHLLKDLSTSGQDWDLKVVLKVDDAGPAPDFNGKLDFLLIEHEDSEAIVGDSQLDESSWSSGSGSVTNIDFTTGGTIGITIGDYVSGGGWVSYMRVQVLRPGTYDGT
jgi:hypothetical protein